MSGEERKPCEVWPLAYFLAEELTARGWTTADLALRMGKRKEFARNLLIADLTMCVHHDKLLLDDDTAARFSKALGPSAQFFKNLDAAWRDNPEARQPFTPPESIFNPAFNWIKSEGVSP